MSNWVGEIYDKEQTIKQTSPRVFISVIITVKTIYNANVKADNNIVNIRDWLIFFFPIYIKYVQIQISDIKAPML